MKKTKHLITIISALVICTGSILLLSSCSGDDAKTEPEPEPIANVFTGQTVDEGYDADAQNRRIVAFVVENAPDARPQWGMDDPDYDPDMILQAEVEGGITRTLWFYDDYLKLPEQIGPMRSARPPFIRFSEFWDAVFIHWGQSHSAGGYVGANEVFKTDKVEHINQMHFGNECGMFDRDSSRGVSSEHTGIIHGDKVEAGLKEDHISKTQDEVTKLQFNETAKPMSDTRADEVDVNYSERASGEDTEWTYNEEDQKYHTDNFKNDLKRDNLLILYSDTEYITKDNYQGPGGASSVTYCDYDLSGGKGKLISLGTVKDITWEKKDGKLLLIDDEATEAAQAKAEEEGTASSDDENAEPIIVEAKLNKGKTWIGWISNNNGGNVEIIANETEESDGEGGDDASN